MPDSQTALKSNKAVKVNRDPWIVFEPIGGMEAAGFIFYPGGRVLAKPMCWPKPAIWQSCFPYAIEPGYTQS